MSASKKVTVSAQLITAGEATKFLRTHTPGTECFFVGEGAAAVGYRGKCAVEDLLRIVANPAHTDRNYVSVMLTTSNPDFGTMAACHLISNTVGELEGACVKGFAVVGDQLKSVPAGMIAGLLFHEYSGSKRQPHGHLLIFPQVVRENGDGQAVFYQLDAENLLKSITG